MPATPLRSLGMAEVLALIPHRPPFLWLDGVDILEFGKRARGTLALPGSATVFQGHFPEEPLFPGVLTTEALAQTCGVLIGHAALEVACREGSHPAPSRWYLARTEMKFLKPVYPGQRLLLDVLQTARTEGLLVFSCAAEVEGAQVAIGRLSLAAAPASSPVGS